MAETAPMSYPALPLRMHVHSDMAGAVEDVGMVRILTMQEIDGKGMYPVREWPNLDQTLGRPKKFAAE